MDKSVTWPLGGVVVSGLVAIHFHRELIKKSGPIPYDEDCGPSLMVTQSTRKKVNILKTRIKCASGLSIVLIFLAAWNYFDATAKIKKWFD